MKKFDPDIISLQEIKLNTESANFKLRFSNYSTYVKARDSGSDWGGGIAILIKNNISHSQIINTDPNIETIGLNVYLPNLTLKFFSYYNPPGKNISREFFENYFDENQNFILVGDLNSKTSVIGCKSFNPSGRVLEKILQDSDLIVFNDHNPTFKKFKSNYEEILDLVIGSSALSKIISGVSVLEQDNMTSDHLRNFFASMCLTLR